MQVRCTRVKEMVLGKPHLNSGVVVCSLITSSASPSQTETRHKRPFLSPSHHEISKRRKLGHHSSTQPIPLTQLSLNWPKLYHNIYSNSI